MLRLGWFSSGRDEVARTALEAVLRTSRAGEPEVSVSVAFCNYEEIEEPGRPDAAERERFYQLLRSYDVPVVALSWKRFRSEMRGADREHWRAAYGAAVRERLAAHPFDVGLVAGYSQPIDEDTCALLSLLALQPTPPKDAGGTRAEAIWKAITTRALDYGLTIRTCGAGDEPDRTATFCNFSLRTPEYLTIWHEMDEGLGRRSVDLLDKAEMESMPLFRRIERDVDARVEPLVVQTVALLAAGKLRIDKGKLYEGDRPLSRPYDLTDAVERAAAGGGGGR
jgi:phosphoribosylglycinamide formyltransferase-1